MKIVELDSGYVVYYETETWTVPKHIMQSLVRLGMEHQRERSAMVAQNEANSVCDHIRAQPISQADIEAAIGEGE